MSKLFWGNQPFTPAEDKYAKEYLGTVIDGKTWMVAAPVGNTKSKSGKPQYNEERIGINFISCRAESGYLLFAGVTNLEQLLPPISETDTVALEAYQKWVQSGMLFAVRCDGHKQLTWLAKHLEDAVITGYLEILTDNEKDVPEGYDDTFSALKNGAETDSDKVLLLSDYGLVVEGYVASNVKLQIAQLERREKFTYTHVTELKFTAPSIQQRGNKGQQINLVDKRADYMSTFLATVEGEDDASKLSKIVSTPSLLLLYYHHLSIACGVNCLPYELITAIYGERNF